MASVDIKRLRVPGSRGFGIIQRRTVTAVRRIPVPLAVLLAVAIAVRGTMWAVYHPTVLNLYDSAVYADMARGNLFADPARTAGYPMFLRGLHAISNQIELTIAAQHLIGIATALLLYATVRRVGAPSWAALIAAAAVLLPVDQVQLEHTLMSEALFTFGLAAVLYAAVRALDPPHRLVGRLTTRHAWLVLAGASLGLCAWVRPVAAPLIPFLALWVVLAISGRWWARVGRGAIAGAAAVAVLLVYFSLNAAETGEFGLSRAPGWALYARTAPFADCSQFAPPEGTRRLCEGTDADQRPGPDFYGWEPKSPARRLFDWPPAGNEQLAAFATQAIEHQPGSYARAVLTDIARYFVPRVGPDRPFFGPGYEALDVGRRAEGVETAIAFSILAYYPDEHPGTERGVGTLSDVQSWLRVHPSLLLLGVVLALIGLMLARGRNRAGLALLLGMGLLLLIVPSATAIYSARYAVPASGPMVAAGAIGLWLAVERLIEARRRKSGARSQSSPEAPG